MSSIRQNKVARLLQKELGDILQKQAGVYCPGGLITVTVLRISPDLSVAKVFLSFFPNEKRVEYLESLNLNKKLIRLELGKRVKNQLRIVPELAFFIDDSLDYAYKIDTLLKS